MANYELKRHKKSDTVKWIIIFLISIALIGAVVGLAIKLERQTTTTTIGGEAYSIGLIDENGDNKEGDTAIYLRNAVTTDGFKAEIAEDAAVTYKLFFYDKDGKFISASAELSGDFAGTIPETAESMRVMITPTEDEDGKVSFTEVLGYAAQVTITVNK